MPKLSALFVKVGGDPSRPFVVSLRNAGNQAVSFAAGGLDVARSATRCKDRR